MSSSFVEENALIVSGGVARGGKAAWLETIEKQHQLKQHPGSAARRNTSNFEAVYVHTVSYNYHKVFLFQWSNKQYLPCQRLQAF